MNINQKKKQQHTSGMLGLSTEQNRTGGKKINAGAHEIIHDLCTVPNK